MHQKFGKILKKYLKGSTDPTNTQKMYVMAVNEYMLGVFNSHISTPAWIASGEVTTTSVPPVTTPLISQVGCVNSFIFKPITYKKLKSYMNNYPIYKGLAKAFEEMINKSILWIDMKTAGYTVPAVCKFVTSLDIFGDKWQQFMDSVSANNMELWYECLDIFVENIWNFVIPISVFYTSPGIGNIFTGTINVTGQGLAS